MGHTCHRCGNKYDRLSLHWGMSDCSFPKITDTQREIITGLIMSDAHISKPSRNGLIDISSTNEKFIHHIDNILGVISCGVNEGPDSKRQKENYTRTNSGGELYEFNDVYRLHTHTHPEFGVMRDRWYTEDGKKYPEDLELTPTSARYWYAGDGGIQKRESGNHRVQITCSNESDRSEFLLSIFDTTPVSPNFSSDRLYTSHNEGLKFLEWIGDSIPGYEYKWEIEL